MKAGPSGEPFFSVIVLNWNGRHLLEECLSSIEAQSFRDFETIVVENGSTDGSVDYLQDRWRGKVRLVELPTNRGFSGGNNAGIQLARGRFSILLNNDTTVDTGWLSALHAAADRHPETGMFTPKVLNYFRRDEIDNTGLIIYSDGLARGRHRLETDDGQFDEEGEVLCPSGCSGVYRKEMLDRIGLLDDSFFAYGEDVDLGLRARWAGWTCIYVPTAVVYHKYSATTGTHSPRKAFLAERNRVWVLLKNFPLQEVLFSPFHTVLRYAFHLYGILSGKGASAAFTRDFRAWELPVIVFRAECSAFARLPSVWAKRRAIASSRKISVREFRGSIRRFGMTVKEVALKD